MGSEGIICFFRKIWYEVEHFVKQFIIHFLFIFLPGRRDNRMGRTRLEPKVSMGSDDNFACKSSSSETVPTSRHLHAVSPMEEPPSAYPPSASQATSIKDIYYVPISSAVLVARAFIPESRYSIFGFPKWLRIEYCSDWSLAAKSLSPHLQYIFPFTSLPLRKCAAFQ